MPAGLEPASGSVRPKQPIVVPAAMPGQPALLLLLAAPAVDREHRQRALHRAERAQPGVARLELQARQPVRRRRRARAAVALQVHAQQTELPELRPDRLRQRARSRSSPPTCGRNFSRTYWRTVSRISRSSSSSRRVEREWIARIEGGKGGGGGGHALQRTTPANRLSVCIAGSPVSMRTWPAYRTLWVFLLLGWTVSAADRALTGPVVTWMIENNVALPRRRRQALRARRPDRRPVLRGLHAHAVPRRLPGRQVRPPHDHRRQPRLGGHRDDAQRRHHRPRRVHRRARASPASARARSTPTTAR